MQLFYHCAAKMKCERKFKKNILFNENYQNFTTRLLFGSIMKVQVIKIFLRVMV